MRIPSPTESLSEPGDGEVVFFTDMLVQGVRLPLQPAVQRITGPDRVCPGPVQPQLLGGLDGGDSCVRDCRGGGALLRAILVPVQHHQVQERRSRRLGSGELPEGFRAGALHQLGADFPEVVEESAGATLR